MNRYKVTIKYREPTYAKARGIEEVTYRGAFEVQAAGPEVAVRIATGLFHDAQRSSSVSWAREIQATTWELLTSERAAV